MLVVIFTGNKGFTLVEIMVSLALGSMLLLGVFKIVDANFKAYRMVISDGGIQVNERISRAIVLRDIKNAGNLGCKQTQSDFEDIEILLGNYPPSAHPDFSIVNRNESGVYQLDPIRIVNNVAANKTISAATQVHTDADKKIVEAGTDILSVVKATPVIGQLYVINNKVVKVSNSHFNKNDYLMLMDCKIERKVELFKIQEVKNLSKRNQKLTLNSAVSAYFSSLVVDKKQVMSVDLYRLEVVSYFVAEGLGSTETDRLLSLYRKVNNQPAVEYVSGVDDFQVAYEVVDASGSSRSYIEGVDLGLGHSAKADIIHASLVFRSDVSKSSSPFKGPEFGKTKGKYYQLPGGKSDGKFRRLASFSGKIRNS